MVDLIERQAAISAVWEPAVNPGGEVFDALKRAQQKVIEALPSAQPGPQWVPCSERLPETNGEVYLVTISEGSNVYVSALQWDTNQKYWYLALMGNEIIRVYQIDGVIAWTAMPEPYKEV